MRHANFARSENGTRSFFETKIEGCPTGSEFRDRTNLVSVLISDIRYPMSDICKVPKETGQGVWVLARFAGFRSIQAKGAGRSNSTGSKMEPVHYATLSGGFLFEFFDFPH